MTSKTTIRHLRQCRSGLTLIELLVVLTVLIALAAIIIPLMPNMLSRSHDASSATNITEISRAVQTYNQLYFGFPNNFDNLVESGSSSALIQTLAGGGNLAGQLQVGTLTQAQATALNNIGITSVANLTGVSATGLTNNPAWSPTFSPYLTVPASLTAIVGGTTASPTYATVAFLTTTNATTGLPSGVFAAQTKLGASPTGQFVVFGFGLANSAVGKVCQECPVHFPDQSTITPAKYYERYGLVFQVGDTANANFQNAVFVGVVCLLDDGIESGNDHIQGFFNLSAQGN